MLAQRYKILQIIGEGANSTVYRAFDVSRHAEVAIKSQFYPSAVTAQAQEYAIHKNLDHEHVLRILDYIRVGSRHYFVFELCTHSLISFVNEYDTNIRGIKRIMRMALLGLHYIHRRGIIHRDIKLSNLLVHEDTVKLCDFGLSCFEKDRNFSHCGTKEYISPEMQKGISTGCYTTYSSKIDIYTLGVVFVALLTRRKDASTQDLAVFGPDIQSLAQGMLEQDPEERYSAEEALSNKIFDELYKEIPDFRLLKEFVRYTKHGKIVRRGNQAEITYESLNKISNISFGYPKCSCRCRGVFQPEIRVDGKAISRAFLTESQLKHYNYLCAFLQMHCDKAVKYKLAKNTFIFTCFISGRYTYSCGGITVGGMMEDNEGRRGLSEWHRENLGILLERFVNNRVCVCEQSVEQEGGSTMSVTIADEPLVELQRVFIPGCGWCIKDGSAFTFLLNDGRHFVIRGDSFILVLNSLKYPIGGRMSKMCKNALLVARMFLILFLKKC